MSTLDPFVARRLATIQLLLDRAVEASRQSGPLGVDAVSRLHDVIEMWLALAARVQGTKIGGTFDDYWNSLTAKLGRPLTHRVRAQTLNKVRVNYKHYGVEPSANEIADMATFARALLEDETPALFGVALADVSLADFVTSERARGMLDAAATKWAAAEVVEAFADLHESFDAVVSDYKKSKITGYSRSVFDFIPDLTTFHDDRENRKVKEAIVTVERIALLSGLGIDLRRYGRFRSLVPAYTKTIGGGRYVQGRDVERSQVDYDFCRDFIITAAIHLSEEDYAFDHWRVCCTDR
ncbi:hypothetical protein [Kineococcus rhizosphaerae]|uniref:Uncharacterized protein n=1 Tax=Kineococcus rhizosphaerae TaxID=559628 RepID=A0A2T0QQ74_9ACTN|nr:hypothetical protein [Kineococcus rhizosphaerae]PRY06860.1 hypothetical protein CLV37_13110 [Kineococcus rhizosphaerae]